MIGEGLTVAKNMDDRRLTTTDDGEGTDTSEILADTALSRDGTDVTPPPKKPLDGGGDASKSRSRRRRRGGGPGKQAAEKTAANSQVDGGGGGAMGGAGETGEKPTTARRRHRRKKSTNHRWKPYNKMTWDEKKELEERETLRASKKRENRLTPYNTTQFLMTDHDLPEPDVGNDGCQPLHNYESSDEAVSSDQLVEEQYFEKDFSETYAQVHAEDLASLPKEDLIKEYLQLENHFAEMESKIKEDTSTSRDYTLKMEIEKLEQENTKLSLENHQLRTEALTRL